MRNQRHLVVLLGAGVVLSLNTPSFSKTQPAKSTPAATSRPAKAARDFSRWEKEISAFERADRENPPSRGGILFIGSSTIRGWKTLQKDYPDHAVINRGFGGSQIVDSTHFADRIILPYEPRVIFLRAGGNDITAGKTAEQVFGDFRAFVARIHQKLPTTQIVFIGLCPAPVRWADRHATRELNRLVEEYCRTASHVKYIEMYDLSVRPDGGPREELFGKDRLHFNADGYKLLADKVRPYLPSK